MSGLKKLALASAISSIAAGAYAGPQLLEDESLDAYTGQAGLTIDVETQWEIGEFVYKDAGHLVLTGIRMGGNSFGSGTGTAGSFLDNLRLEVDIAGDGTDGDNILAYGFSNMRDIAQLYIDAGNPDGAFASVAGGIDPTREGGLPIDDVRSYDDGDLVIHFDFTDGWDHEGGFAAYQNAGRFNTDSYSVAELVLEEAVDFRLEIDSIGLASSSYTIGSESPETTLISNLGIQGYLGPEDLVIENDGNGFGDASLGGIEGPLGPGTGTANSKIIWSAYSLITDMDLTIDIAGLNIIDMKIHNKRGDRTGLDDTSSFDFAHSIREIYAVRQAVFDMSNSTGTYYTDGIAINTRFKGDIDIGALTFGDDDRSIGSLYFTDIESTTNWTISAH